MSCQGDRLGCVLSPYRLAGCQTLVAWAVHRPRRLASLDSTSPTVVVRAKRASSSAHHHRLGLARRRPGNGVDSALSSNRETHNGIITLSSQNQADSSAASYGTTARARQPPAGVGALLPAHEDNGSSDGSGSGSGRRARRQAPLAVAPTGRGGVDGSAGFGDSSSSSRNSTSSTIAAVSAARSADGQRPPHHAPDGPAGGVGQDGGGRLAGRDRRRGDPAQGAEGGGLVCLVVSLFLCFG